MKRIKKELLVFLVILILGCLFVICAVARAEQIDKHQTKNVSYEIAHK